MAPPIAIPLRADLLKQPHVHCLHQNLPRATASCVETVQLFARHLGLSRGVARQLSLCHRSSSCRVYQYCWECYQHWCSDQGHSVSNPSCLKIADFLLFLRSERWLSVATVKGHHSTFSSVFKFRLLIHSFELEHPLRPVSPPAWDLVKVLAFLRGPTFEPLSTSFGGDDEGVVPSDFGDCKACG